MDKDMIALWAEAKRAGIKDYRKVPPAQLRAMIGNAKGKGSTPAKGKTAAANGRTSTNGTKGKTAATAVVKGKVTPARKPAAPAKGKATVSTPPAKGRGKIVPAKPTPAAKSNARKTVPAKGKATAAQGKATRSATGGTRKATTTTTAKRPTARGAAAQSYAVRIDNRSINWKAEWGGGTTGKRGIVMDSLRKNKGDKAKVFAEVKRYAVKWYPDKDKNAADRMVVWLIGRVALDFVKGTGQHESGVRAGYGESTNPNDVRRREARAAARPAPRRRATPAKPAAARKPAGRGKPAPAARKPAAARTAAQKGKTAAKPAARKAPTRKPVAIKPKGKAAAAKGRR